MASTARPRVTGTQQPDTTRASVVPPMVQGGKPRMIHNQSMGPYLSNQYGNNTIPVDVLNAPLSSQQAPTTFLPGDPVRATPGLDDGFSGPRIWSYPVGTNINPLPRQTEFVPFEMLRGLARNYYGVGLCLEVHNRIIQRLEPQFKPRTGLVPDGEDPTSPKWMKPAMLMNEWLMDGPNVRHDGRDLHGWLSALHRDLMEIDAASIYNVRTKAGWLDGLRLIASDTIQVLFDTTGERPMPPYAAYRQVLYGAPAKTLTADDLDYLVFNPRSDSPYGISPVERMLITVNEALRKQDFDLRRFTDGATPSGLLINNNATTSNWTPEQVRLFERNFNDILAGNSALRVRAKALPPGWDFKTTDEKAIDTQFDRFLLNVAAAMFGLTMDELAFTETSNRSVGQSQEAVTYRNAIKPRSDFLARYLTRVCHRYDGQPLMPHNPTVSRKGAPTQSKGVWDGRYALTWGGIEEPDDFTTKAEAVGNLFQKGVLTRLQAKRVLKLEVEQGEEDTPPFTTYQGGMTSVIPLQDIEASRNALQQQLQASADSAQVGVETAKAGAHIQEDQGKMLDSQVQQAQSSAEENLPPEDEGEGESGPVSSEPPPPAPKGGKGKAAPEEPPPSDTSTPDTTASDDASGQVDQLIASAKDKLAKAKNKAKRFVEAENTRVVDPTDISREWAAYRDVALRAIKRGRAMPAFQTEILPAHLHTYAAQALQKAENVEAVRAVFANIRDAETHATDCRCMVCGCGSPHDDHGMPFEILSPNDQGVYENHTGCMIAFFLPSSCSQQLALPDGCPPSELHITLAYLGDITKDQIDKSRLLECVKQWAMRQSLIEVDLDHVERFPGDAETYPVIVRSFTSALMDLRADLVQAVDAAGLQIDQTYPDYKPHVTLAYLPQGAPMPDISDPNAHCTLSHVWVAYGDERYAYPLGGDPERNQTVTELRALRAQVLQAIGAEATL